MTNIDFDKLLTEAEGTLYHISCLLPLIYNADFEKYPVEIEEALQSLEQMAEKTRERISTSLVMLHLDMKKAIEAKL